MSSIYVFKNLFAKINFLRKTQIANKDLIHAFTKETSLYPKHSFAFEGFLNYPQKKQNFKVDALEFDADEKLEFHSFIYDILQTEEIWEMQNFSQHKNTNTFDHSMHVTYLSYYLCKHFHPELDLKSCTRGALLHDFYLYDYHLDPHPNWHGFVHPDYSLRNAEKHFDLNEIEKDVIRNHMWPLTIYRKPKFAETHLVAIIDKYCTISELLSK